MKGRVLNLLTALSLLVLIAVSAMWARSRSFADIRAWTSPASGVEYSVWSINGVVYVRRCAAQTEGPWSLSQEHPARYNIKPPVPRTGTTAGVIRYSAADASGIPYGVLGLSYAWPFAAAAAAVALACLGRARAHRWRRRAILGQCGRCGYDLRATPGRCPECGTIPAAAPAK